MKLGTEERYSLCQQGVVMNEKERIETLQTPLAATGLKRTEVFPNMATIGRSSWSAIFSGVVIALILNVTLGLMGIGIGLSSISASPTQGTLQGVGIGAMIWALIIGVASMYFGGWVTSRFAGMQRALDGMLHGLVTWGVTSMVVMLLLTSAVGTAIGGGLSILRSGSSVYGVLPPQTQQQLRQGMQGGAQQGGTNQNQQRVMPPSQEKTEQIGTQAAAVTSGAAWGGFLILLLGGAAAAMGGAAGRIKGPVKI